MSNLYERLATKALTQMATDIDEVAKTMNLENTFSDFPSLVEWYRRLMALAWIKGAVWGFGQGGQAGAERVHDEIKKMLEEQR